MPPTRREFLTTAATVYSSVAMPFSMRASDQEEVRHIATNTYPWSIFAKREGEPFELHTPQMLRDIESTGITGYEPIIESPMEFDGLAAELSRHGLHMHSLYVNSVLHDPKLIDENIGRVMAIARAAKGLGTKIIVTNPSPIRWGGDEDKSDDQLKHQARALDRMGKQLREEGLTLAYHNHDAELRQGGREFHHMLTATDPENVKFCLDAHWVYRGCGDSEVAVFDAVEHYWERIVELHLRQSQNGIWTETFTLQGDINYQRLFDLLTKRGVQPHLVLEQIVEAGSPHELTAVEAHRESYQNLEKWRGRSR